MSANPLDTLSKYIKNGLFDGADEKASLEDCLQAMKNHECIRIKMSYCPSIGDKGTALLASHLSSNSTITSLNLASCDMGDTGAVALFEFLRENTTLEELVLYGNPIGTKGLLALATMQESNTSLKRIDAIGVSDRVEVDQECVYSALLSAVKLNKTVQALRLSYSYPQQSSSIGCKWMTLINAELGKNRSLVGRE
jgi:hypothetical protein